MSVASWSVCPACLKRATKAKEQQLREALAAYGQVQAEVYDRLIGEARTPLEMEPSLRENYQLGTDGDGVFWVAYRCSCTSCPFAHEFRHQQQLLLDVGGVAEGG